MMKKVKLFDNGDVAIKLISDSSASSKASTAASTSTDSVLDGSSSTGNANEMIVKIFRMEKINKKKYVTSAFGTKSSVYSSQDVYKECDVLRRIMVLGLEHHS